MEVWEKLENVVVVKILNLLKKAFASFKNKSPQKWKAIPRVAAIFLNNLICPPRAGPLGF